MIERPAQGEVDVFALLTKPDAAALLVFEQSGSEPLTKARHPLRVRLPHDLGPTRILQTLCQILTDRFEQPVSGGHPVEGDYRLGYELIDAVEDVDGAAADRLDGVQPETTCEYRQPPGQGLLVHGEQVVAPIEGHSNCLVPGIAPAGRAPASQHTDLVPAA